MPNLEFLDVMPFCFCYLAEDGPLTFIPLLDDEDFENEEDPERTQEDDPSKEGTPDDDDDSDIHNIGAAAQGGRHDNQGGGDRRAKYDPRREVTYEVFAYEMWPKINKKKLSYHPTLIWMEIASFIKGRGWEKVHAFF